MESKRQQKISRLLQKETAEMFQQELRELAHGGMISITKASVSSDLSIVKFYVSIFPPDRKDVVMGELKNQITRIRYMLGQRIGKQLRIVPEPHFFIDDTLDYLEKIDKLLAE